ncbi:hypothetical protein IWX49DRAFT_642336, partial [Phyllosticta citricarpa]
WTTPPCPRPRPFLHRSASSNRSLFGVGNPVRKRAERGSAKRPSLQQERRSKRWRRTGREEDKKTESSTDKQDALLLQPISPPLSSLTRKAENKSSSRPLSRRCGTKLTRLSFGRELDAGTKCDRSMCADEMCSSIKVPARHMLSSSSKVRPSRITCPHILVVQMLLSVRCRGALADGRKVSLPCICCCTCSVSHLNPTTAVWSAPSIPRLDQDLCSARSAPVFQTVAGSRDTMSTPWNQVMSDSGNAGPVLVAAREQ